MIGLKKRDIKKVLKAGAKAGGMSLTDVWAISKSILATNFICQKNIFIQYQKDKSVIQNKFCKGKYIILEHFKHNSIQSYTT